jgi:hypothetical protein
MAGLGPLNIPNVTTDNYSFGPGILKLGPAGATPTLDVGSVAADGVLEIQSTSLDLRLGSPSMLVKRYMQVSDVMFSISGLEWDYDNFLKAMGAGITSATQFDFGGDPNITNYALQFQHRMPSGATQTIRIWEVVGSGETQFNFGEDFHEFPMQFQAIRKQTDWASNALSTGAQYFRIVKAT